VIGRKSLAGRLFGRKALSVAWQYDVTGILWRVLPDGEGGVIGEARDTETKSATYFRVLLGSGAPAWKDVEVPGGWWTGIECVAGRVLFLHGFASPDLPGHRGIIAVDLRDGALLWSDDRSVFVAVAGGRVYGVRENANRRDLVDYDALTGVVGGVVPAVEERMSEIIARSEQGAPPEVALPEPVRPGVGEFEFLRGLPAGALQSAGSLEALRMEGVTIAAHHEPAPADPRGRQGIRRVLSVFGDERKSPQFREILDDHLTVPVPDAFLVVGRTLLFVKNRRSLCAVRLPAAGQGR
jgi:hypothetical protein